MSVIGERGSGRVKGLGYQAEKYGRRGFLGLFDLEVLLQPHDELPLAACQLYPHLPANLLRQTYKICLSTFSVNAFQVLL